MGGQEAEKIWERIRASSDVLNEQLKYFPYTLDGVISALSKNDDRIEKLRTLKGELERINISVSEYKTWNDQDRYILIKMPTYFSERKGGINQKEFQMGGKYINSMTLANLIILLDDFEKRIIKDEAEIMPGEPSSANHQGGAYKLLKAIEMFRAWILEFATEM